MDDGSSVDNGGSVDWSSVYEGSGMDYGSSVDGCGVVAMDWGVMTHNALG